MSFHPFHSSRYRKESDISRYSQATRDSDSTYVDSVRQAAYPSGHRHIGCFGIRPPAFAFHNHFHPGDKSSRGSNRSWSSKTIKSMVYGLAFDRQREKHQNPLLLVEIGASKLGFLPTRYYRHLTQNPIFCLT